MTNPMDTLEAMLTKDLKQEGFDLIDIIPLPTRGDRMVRLKTIDEILYHFDTKEISGSFGYIVQLKPLKTQERATKNHSPINKSNLDGIYLPNGKLNCSYLFNNGELLFKTKEYALAKNIFYTLLKSGESSGLAHYWLGKCFEGENYFLDAQKHITYNPTTEAFVRLASVLVEQKKYQEATELMEKSLGLKDLNKPTKSIFHKIAANCYLKTGKTENAELHFKKALEINPTSEELLTSLGDLYCQTGKNTEAKHCYREAYAANPKNFSALSGLGNCSYEMGDKPLAHDYYLKSLELNIHQTSIIFSLIKCAYEIKSYSKAAEFVRKFADVSPVNIQVLYSLAGLEFHLGRIEESKALTLKIIELQPEHTGARELLELIAKYCGMGNLNVFN